MKIRLFIINKNLPSHTESRELFGGFGPYEASMSFDKFKDASKAEQKTYQKYAQQADEALLGIITQEVKVRELKDLMILICPQGNPEKPKWGWEPRCLNGVNFPSLPNLAESVRLICEKMFAVNPLRHQNATVKLDGLFNANQFHFSIQREERLTKEEEAAIEQAVRISMSGFIGIYFTTRRVIITNSVLPEQREAWALQYADAIAKALKLGKKDLHQKFEATHRIFLAGGETEDVMLKDGAAYSKAEWKANAPADYELVFDLDDENDRGKWLFLGQPFKGKVVPL